MNTATNAWDKLKSVILIKSPDKMMIRVQNIHLPLRSDCLKMSRKFKLQVICNVVCWWRDVDEGKCLRKFKLQILWNVVCWWRGVVEGKCLRKLKLQILWNVVCWWRGVVEGKCLKMSAQIEVTDPLQRGLLVACCGRCWCRTVEGSQVIQVMRGIQILGNCCFSWIVVESPNFHRGVLCQRVIYSA